MKTAEFIPLLLVAGSAVAAPSSKVSEAVTISGLSADQTNTTGWIEFILDDPNYQDVTGANIQWSIPGQPLADSRTEDGNYYVEFPGGVNDIGVFDLVITRVKGPEQISYTLNDNKNGGAPGSKWECITSVGSVTTEKCYYHGNITVVPSTSF
ncbi:hypothetical protein N7468_007491 [Penicillium chermesinum]|uniref:Uncharacterized protein n=1 Tax=Penicillium chermesinum TaxID=63820 RepID=A0A9W9TKM3_9EURO|nr:uncharacterized protein N7468_007491 [Penicillium chermesinum]KAJ5226266.1 hypothetical protein N7468_007491 [Penicillium chermesinum]KAJ6160551.1 hypothetical protein N7470_003947 [Penicillium chermesinum]